MTTQKLLQIIQEALSSGTLHPSDEIIVYNHSSGNFYPIELAECDTQSSDFLIGIKE